MLLEKELRYIKAGNLSHLWDWPETDYRWFGSLRSKKIKKSLLLHPRHVWSCYRWSSKIVCYVWWGCARSNGFYKPSGKSVLPDYRLLPSKGRSGIFSSSKVNLPYSYNTNFPFSIQSDGQTERKSRFSPLQVDIHARPESSVGFRDWLRICEMLWDKGNSLYSSTRLTSSPNSAGTRAILKALAHEIWPALWLIRWGGSQNEAHPPSRHAKSNSSQLSPLCRSQSGRR